MSAGPRKGAIQFKFHMVLPSIIKKKKKTHSNGSHDAYSASRLNIFVATSPVIDSGEINSAAP